MTIATSINARAESPELRPIGVRHGSTEYQISCSEESACNAEMARVCPKGHFVTAFMEGGPLSYDFVCTQGHSVKTDKLAKPQMIQVFISPDCKDIFYGPDFVQMDANGKKSARKKRPKPDYVPWNPDNAMPMAYKDPRSSIVIYVESDGRHVGATDMQGNLLWVRNPWEEGHTFCPYRTPRPVVNSLKMAEFTDSYRTNLERRGANLNHRFIRLAFDSSQFGVLDESTGDFFPEGQN
jgi:hypothetical protein